MERTGGFTTQDEYLTDQYENSSTNVNQKCKKICKYSLLVGSWSLFFTLGYHFNHIKEYLSANTNF